MGFSSVVCAGLASSFYGCAITAETIGQEARDAADCSNTDAGQVVNLAIGQVLLEIFDHLPTIYECLEFCGGAQILEEIAALVPRLEADDGLKQGVFGALLLAFGIVSVGFHSESMY